MGIWPIDVCASLLKTTESPIIVLWNVKCLHVCDKNVCLLIRVVDSCCILSHLVLPDFSFDVFLMKSKIDFIVW